uniref:Uncharacterized protein n=1 Tax=Globodera rostochiensis TaxID=31243 RepID=A0A914GXG3_GLORO
MLPFIFCLALTAIVGIEGEDVFLDVLDVGNCRKAVKVYCPCGWARCVRTLGSCMHELSECCPSYYDIKCCAKKHRASNIAIRIKLSIARLYVATFDPSDGWTQRFIFAFYLGTNQTK